MKFKPLDRVDFIAVHVTGDHPDKAWDVSAATIRQAHRQSGLRDIAYHFVIRSGGQTEAGRPTDRPGAHDPRINSRSLSICLVGRGKAADNYTPAQLASLETTLRDLLAIHPNAEVIGQRAVNGKSAGFDVVSWWEALNQQP